MVRGILSKSACAVATLCVVVSGCGDAEEPTSGDAFAEGDAALTVTLDPDGPDGPEPPDTEEVSCEEVSEDAVCVAIRDLEASDFDPVPADQACTELFGGPDVAAIEGALDGEDVDVELTRANGCEIERFDAAVPLLQALFKGYEPGQALAEPAP